MQSLLPGITAERVPAGRLTMAVLSATYVKPPFVPAELDIFVESMLSTRTGDDHYPGPDACPPQPMVAQTRAVLDGYAAAGGRYRETVIADSGHGPHLDQPEQFRAALAEHLAGAGQA